MFKPLGIALLFCLSANGWADSRLTDLENEWLNAGSPVLDYAEDQKLPIDIIVQPEPTKGMAPVAMGFDQGRCKLVFSLRGNPEADTVLDKVAKPQRAVLMEAMIAHELAHCWRYLNGSWHTVPAGFVTAVDTDNSSAAAQRMQETRREEGFADLVGLAWIKRAHPEQYAQVHAWFQQVRHDHVVPGSFHDTGTWVELARDPAAFEAHATPFEQAQRLWVQGLRTGP